MISTELGEPLSEGIIQEDTITFHHQKTQKTATLITPQWVFEFVVVLIEITAAKTPLCVILLSVHPAHLAPLLLPQPVLKVMVLPSHGKPVQALIAGFRITKFSSEFKLVGYGQAGRRKRNVRPLQIEDLVLLMALITTDATNIAFVQLMPLVIPPTVKNRMSWR